MYHEPVLVNEVNHYLLKDRKGFYLDGTAGGGGHSEAILNQLSSSGTLISLDMDDDAIEFAGARLNKFGKQSTIIKSNFKDFDIVLAQLGVKRIDGILLDLGVSSHQLNEAERGFSFSQNARLDMRMNRTQTLSAFDIVNEWPHQELKRILKDYGEERRAAQISRAIVKTREQNQIETTRQLAAIVTGNVHHKYEVKTLARVFQALRIAVNEELRNLKEALEKSMLHINEGGRIVVLSYHSLEDRMTKHFFKHEAARCECPPRAPVCFCNKKDRVKILTRKAVTPGVEELSQNPRSRSAKLRAAELIAVGE